MSRIRWALDDLAAVTLWPRSLLALAFGLYALACSGYAASGLITVLS